MWRHPPIVQWWWWLEEFIFLQKTILPPLFLNWTRMRTAFHENQLPKPMLRGLRTKASQCLASRWVTQKTVGLAAHLYISGAPYFFLDVWRHEIRLPKKLPHLGSNPTAKQAVEHEDSLIGSSLCMEIKLQRRNWDCWRRPGSRCAGAGRLIEWWVS